MVDQDFKATKKSDHKCISSNKTSDQAVMILIL